VNPLDVHVAETAREVLDGNPLYLGFQGRVRAANAAQLAAVDDVEVDGKEVLWALRHIRKFGVYLNIALKKQLGVFSNLYNAGFGHVL
jgi:hypothetical protein